MPLTYRALGRTGLSVTPITFGTSGLGDMPETYGYSVDAERAHATIRAIFAGPANVIDTSRNYGTGRAEERIGAVIKELGGLPKGFLVSSKLDRDFATSRFDAARARRSLEESSEGPQSAAHRHSPFARSRAHGGPEGSDRQGRPVP